MGRVGTRSSQKGPHETLVRHLRGKLRRLPRRLVLLPRIVSGVDVGDALRTHPMQLDDTEWRKHLAGHEGGRISAVPPNCLLG